MGKTSRNTGEARRGDGPVTVDELAQEVYNEDEICYNSKVQPNNTEETMTKMSKQEELALIKKAKAGSTRAQAAILEKYDRLCHKLARKFAFTAPSYQHEDPAQEGRIGLLGRQELRNCECAEKYGLTKYAVNSHTYSFKRKAREMFPELQDFV